MILIRFRTGNIFRQAWWDRRPACPKMTGKMPVPPFTLGLPLLGNLDIPGELAYCELRPVEE